MNLKKYQKYCKKTAKKNFKSKEEEIMTWGLGVAGESGDIAGCIKKTFAHDNNQEEGIKENLGDTLWYISMICNFFNWSLEDILNENFKKLEKRFPTGFNIKTASRKNTRIDWNEK